jgi:hypothetical protein
MSPTMHRAAAQSYSIDVVVHVVAHVVVWDTHR